MSEMTDEQIRAEIDDEFRRWDELMKNGGSDPMFPDGTNLNLIRNHIIRYLQILGERSEHQLSLFGDATVDGIRELPPEVPEGYMVPNGAYFAERVEKLRKFRDNLVFDLNGGENA